MGPALFSLLHAASLTKACELADAIWMKQGSTVPTAHRNRDGRNCSLLDHLIDKSLSDPRVAVFLQLPTAARTSALATILDSDEGRRGASGSLRPYPSGTWSRSGMQSGGRWCAKPCCTLARISRLRGSRLS